MCYMNSNEVNRNGSFLNFRCGFDSRRGYKTLIINILSDSPKREFLKCAEQSVEQLSFDCNKRKPSKVIRP